MIIDFHAHMASQRVFPGYFIDGIVEGFMDNKSASENPTTVKKYLQSIMTKVLNDENCSNLLKQMQEGNIDRTVLLIADLGFGKESERLTISEIFELHRKVLESNPDHFIVFAGIDPRRGDFGINLFEKSIREYGFKGLKLYPPCGFELDDSCVIPYFELCKTHRIPVVTHTGASLKGLYNNYDYVGSLNKLAKLYKDVVFVIAHGTYSDFEQNLKLALEMENVYLDISAFQNDLDKECLLNKLTVLGRKVPEKVLFGTDWPLYLLSGAQKRWVNFIIDSGAFSEDALDRVFFKNAYEVLQG